jgi:hypothetical protein
MSILQFESPLQWPQGMPITARTALRSDHGFPESLAIEEAIHYLEEEVAGLATQRAALSLDIENPLSPRLRKKTGNRQGVSLHFKWQGKAYVLACDRWLNTEHNIYALHLAIRQWRNIERYGISPMQTLLMAFEVDRMPEMDIGASDHSLAPCLEAFGLAATATLEDAIAVYHRRAKAIAHDNDALTRLNTQMEEVRHYFADKT